MKYTYSPNPCQNQTDSNLSKELLLLFSALGSREFLIRSLRDQTAFDRLRAHPDAVDVAVGLDHLDLLQIRLEPALRLAGDLAADAALPFGDAAVNVGAARSGLLACQ